MSLLATHPLSVDSLVKIMKAGPGVKPGQIEAKIYGKSKPKKNGKKIKKMKIKTIKIKTKKRRAVSKRKDIFS